MSNSTPLAGDRSTSLIDSAASSADQALRSAQRSADRGFDQMGAQVENLRNRADSAVDGLATEAAGLARRGSDAVRQRSQQLRQQAHQARESATGYIQHEPLKSVLIAVAVGAGLMLLGSLLGRRDPG